MDPTGKGNLTFEQFVSLTRLLDQAKGKSRSRSASAASHTSTLSIPEDERVKFEQYFATLDSSKTGYVSGAPLVNFLSKSGLKPDILAQIWEQADASKDGKLDKQEFFVAMMLVKKKLAEGKAQPPKMTSPILVPSLVGTASNNSSRSSVRLESPVYPQPLRPQQVAKSPESSMSSGFAPAVNPAIDLFTTQMDSLEKTVIQTQKEAAAIKDQIQNTANIKNEKKEKIEALRSLVETEKASLTEFQRKLEAAKIEIADLEREIERTEFDIQNIKNERKEYEEGLKEQNERLLALRKKMSDLNSEKWKEKELTNKSKADIKRQNDLLVVQQSMVQDTLHKRAFSTEENPSQVQLDPLDWPKASTVPTTMNLPIENSESVESVDFFASGFNTPVESAKEEPTKNTTWMTNGDSLISPSKHSDPSPSKTIEFDVKFDDEPEKALSLDGAIPTRGFQEDNHWDPSQTKRADGLDPGVFADWS